MPTSNCYAFDDVVSSQPHKYGSGVSCRKCDARLPIRLADDGEEPALWECAGCGSRLAGLLLTRFELPTVLEIRLADVHFDSGRVPPAPRILNELVRQFSDVEPEYKGPDRRMNPRIARRLDLVLAPMNGQLSPTGSCIRALAHNVSERGMGLLSTLPITTPNIAILIECSDGNPIQVVGQVRRMQQLIGNFHEVGVRFLFRLGSSPVN